MVEGNPNAPPGPPVQGMSSTAKWVIGCAIAFFVVAALACGGLVLFGWWGVSKVKEYAVAMQKYSANIQGQGEVGALYDQARAAAPFDANKPADLTAERFATYLQVREALKPVVEKHKTQIQLASSKTGTANDLGVYLQLLEAWNDVKLEHAKLLAREKMSPEEYGRITRLVYGALLTENVAAPEELTGVNAPDEKEAAVIRPHLAELKSDLWTSVDALLIGTDTAKYKPKGRSKSGWDDGD